MELLGLKSEASGKCLTGQQGAMSLVAQRRLITSKVMRKEPTSHLIYYLSKRFPNGFMASTASLNSSLIQRDFHFVSDGPV